MAQHYKGPWAMLSSTKGIVNFDDVKPDLEHKLTYALTRDGVREDEVVIFWAWYPEEKLLAGIALSRQHIIMPPIEPWQPKENEHANS